MVCFLFIEFGDPIEICLEIVVFLFWSFPSHSRIFHSFGDVTILGEGLQILTYVRHLCPLSSEGFLACHTYCYRWKWWHLHMSENFSSGAKNPKQTNILDVVCDEGVHEMSFYTSLNIIWWLVIISQNVSLLKCYIHGTGS